jgi:acetyltransferase-like isoleucine patch superfamily enzyme
MKSEKEKMLSGMPYRAHDRQLSDERDFAKALIFHYNNLPPDKDAERIKILKSLLGKSGDTFHIEPPFRCDYGYNIEIGEGFFSNYNLVILDCARTTIGDNVLVGPNVGIYTAGHPVHFEDRARGYEFALPVTIGNNVWIGGNVVINPGIRVGDNSVIGSGSVVTKDIPPDVIAFGNPCRVMRNLTDDTKE